MKHTERLRVPLLPGGCGRTAGPPPALVEPDGWRDQARLNRARQLAGELAGPHPVTLRALQRSGVSPDLVRHVASESPQLVRLVADGAADGAAVELTRLGRRLLLNEKE